MERQSNIELLRILSMFAIVIGHFILQTDTINVINDNYKFFAIFLSSARRMAVGVFLMIGCWFMVDSKFKASRILNLYFQLLFYTLAVFLIMKIFGIPLGTADTIRLLLPFSNFSLWFVSGYICLIALSPFLQNITEWERIKLRNFLILLFAGIFLFSMIFINQDTKMCVLLSFMYYFTGMGYYKKYLHGKIKINKNVVLFAGILLYTIIVSVKYFCFVHDADKICHVIDSYIKDYHCLLNLCCSFPVFYWFINTKMPTNKIINYASRATLAVYILHQAPGFIHYLWYNIYHFDKLITSVYFPVYLLLIPVPLYLSCIITELFRKKVFEPVLQRTCLYKFLCTKIDKFYNPCLQINNM